MMNLHRIVLALLGICAATTAHADGSMNKFFMPKEVATAAAGDEVVIFPAKRVITMGKGIKEAGALAVVGRRIFGVGTVAELQRQAGKRKVYVDERFKDKFILPGLIDQHLHPVLGSLTLSTDVIATEDWILPGRTIKAASSPGEYMSRLRQAEQAMKDPKEPLISWGYHKLWHGKLTRAELDKVSSTRPIIIWQRSAHEVYLNTAALQLLNIRAADFEGLGTPSTMANYEEGHFWEQGFMNTPVMPKTLALLASPERLTFGLKQLVVYLHSRGVTAYNEPGAITTPEIWKLYKQILGDKDTPIYTTFLATAAA